MRIFCLHVALLFGTALGRPIDPDPAVIRIRPTTPEREAGAKPPRLSVHGPPPYMNPLPYTLGNPAPGQEGKSQVFASSEYFEVDSPVMKMQYSQVVWTTLPAVPLPAHIVARYAKSTMAITGFEVDLLRKNNATGQVESVPAYENYNHHYGVALHSTAVTMRLDDEGQPTGRDMGHGKMLEFDIRDDVDAPPADAKLAQSFVHGNGQEHRQIFHGAPPGFAFPLYSPGTFVVTPMQISTNDGTGRKTGFDWLLPRIKQRGGATPADPDAKYAPILECPCTTRVDRATLKVDGDCREEPLSDLLATHNPTCQASSYVGGLNCCGNGQFLLDADQAPPPFVDEVFFRFRFYFEDHDAGKHEELYHAEWAGNGCDSGCGGDCPNSCKHIEFDVVQGRGSPEGRDVQVFQSTFPAWDMLARGECAATSLQCFPTSAVDEEKGFKLVMAATHCHAPNCIRQELINKDTGEVICRGVPKHGQSEKDYDEEGYLYTPPCLWGDAADGLLPPPVLHRNTTLQMVTAYNSTYHHPGQMAIWQMKAAPIH